MMRCVYSTGRVWVPLLPLKAAMSLILECVMTSNAWWIKYTSNSLVAWCFIVLVLFVVCHGQQCLMGLQYI